MQKFPLKIKKYLSFEYLCKYTQKLAGSTLYCTTYSFLFLNENSYFAQTISRGSPIEKQPWMCTGKHNYETKNTELNCRTVYHQLFKLTFAQSSSLLIIPPLFLKDTGVDMTEGESAVGDQAEGML